MATDPGQPTDSKSMDENGPYPADEFGPGESRLFALAGTVGLPSPRPATARLYLGKNRKAKDDSELPASLPAYYLKSVQTVGDSLEVTRIVNLDDLRAIDLFPSRTGGQAPAKQEELNKQETPCEVRLFAGQEAVIYVPESAPVYVRLVYQFGVTASVAAENVEGLASEGGCCK